MAKRRVIGILIMLLFVFAANAQRQFVEVLHYNLLATYGTNPREYRSEKEQEVATLFASEKATIYSILEDGGRASFMREKTFLSDASYELRESTTSSLHHALYFDKEKIAILQSQSYASEQALFFYYELRLKGTETPVHLIVYKQDVMEHPISQHQEILDFVNAKKIKGELLLLGGSPYPIRMLKERYIGIKNADIELINLKTLFYLYDDEYKFIWHDGVDFLYVSKDVWLPGEGAITYERKNQYLDESALFDENLQVTPENQPFAFRIEINDEQETNIYKTPEAEIIAQDKESLLFSITWDEDVTLDVEIVSMIGNSFLRKNIAYQGVKKEYKADIANYPTGIYLLKISDEEGHTIFRKFTKY